MTLGGNAETLCTSLTGNRNIKVVGFLNPYDCRRIACMVGHKVLLARAVGRDRHHVGLSVGPRRYKTYRFTHRLKGDIVGHLVPLFLEPCYTRRGGRLLLVR